MTSIPADKDAGLLGGVDAQAHRVFRDLDVARGRVPSAELDEAVTIVAADPAWPRKFRQEAARLKHALPPGLVPEIQHIGSTAVSGLDGKPVVDLMVGIARPSRIGELVLALEGLGYESLGEAGVPGLWALRRRDTCPGFNVSIIAHSGPRWRQNLAVREKLRGDPEAAAAYAAAKWAAIKAGATTLFAYSDAKRAVIEVIAGRRDRADEAKQRPRRG
jgi:GrpB-like predicted nucleotidyltransferase (UPF0157 family)